MKSILKISAFVLPAVMFVVPYAVLAQSCGGSNLITNPLGGNICSVTDLINKLIDIAIQVAAPIAILAVIYAGFLFIKAQGNEDKLKEARKIFFYTVIGILVLYGAKAIAVLVQGTINAIGQ